MLDAGLKRRYTALVSLEMRAFRGMMPYGKMVELTLPAL